MKQVEFDIELVKKIQAGEVKGFIKTRDGNDARFLGEIKHPEYPLVFVKKSRQNDEELLESYTLTGKYYAGFNRNQNDIILEIEDEQKKPEHQLEIGDKVRIKLNSTHGSFVREYNGRIGKIVGIHNEFFVVIVNGAFQDKFAANELELFEKQKNHELKPFDKVLVRDRDTEEWKADFFSRYYTDYRYDYECVSGAYIQCIPYEGNQDLVGTTKTPKDYGGK